jgi:rhamnogalacturonyl hydrolase YesR
MNNSSNSTLFITIIILSLIFLAGCSGKEEEEEEPQTDTTVALHAMQPDYPIPYGAPERSEVISVLSRVHDYLDSVTPMQIVDEETGEPITDFSSPNENAIFEQGDFRLISYEWGVTYAGMLLAGEATGDEKFTQYTTQRLNYIREIGAGYRDLLKEHPELEDMPVESVINPGALDDAGAMSAAMIKATEAGNNENLDWMIDNYIDYISNDQYRFEDGTLARNRPQPNTLWLDDLFMSVPALAQMGHYSGEQQYFDDAVMQVRQFADRMFNNEMGLYFHGWVRAVDDKPEFYWGRANGWALMAKVELLEVLPENHPGYEDVLQQLQSHIEGLSNYQSGSGLWHQLLNRTDSYLETSASAIYTYSIARAINRGWVDAKSYGPMALLAWNGVSTKVNEEGQVEGTCVGTGMAFDPAFYYHRPINVYAAHGYGPVILAGAEVLNLLENHKIEINDSALQFYD